MFEAIAARLAGAVTRRPHTVVVVVLLLTVGVGGGLAQLDMEDQTDIDEEIFEATEVGEALAYTQEQYGDDEETAVSSVYIRPEGDALSRSGLIGALEYQADVLDAAAVRTELVADEAIRGPPILVGEHLAGENATMTEMKTAIERIDEEELLATIETIFADRAVAGQYLPRGYTPGTATAESMRLFVTFEQAGYTQQQEPLPDPAAQQVLYETAQETDDVFTMGMPAQEEWDEQQIRDTFWLIVPAALLLVLGVMAVAYRDPIDVVLGFIGVCVSLVWFFGILGWLGIPAGFASIVGPILIVALSIDFGLHVFMRYREQRERFREPSEQNAERDAELVPLSRADESARTDGVIHRSMYHSSRSVIVAFLLVAITAGVGFMANATNPIGFIRAFGVVITLGVLASVFIFITLIPALKLLVDSRLEQWGIDRHRSALGTRGLVKPVLSAGVTVARYGALLVLVVAVVGGGLGLLAYSDLDRQGFQQDFVQADDWQTALPDPIGWSAHETEYRQQLDYVQSQYQSDDERERTTTFLVRGDVTDVTALERLHVGTTLATGSEITFEQGGEVAVVSPLSLIETLTVHNEAFASLVAGAAEDDDQFAALLEEVAAENEQFGQTLETAEPAPDVDLTALYDALYERAPAAASDVLERTDGTYESMRLIVPVDQGVDIDERGAEMHTIADGLEGETDLDVVPVDFATVSNAGLGEIADSILWTMLLAFAGVAAILGVMYRIERDSWLLGAVTVVPICMVVGFVFGGMYLFGVSLTFITAFLVSITIGLGIDYNIHISDRFAQEFEHSGNAVPALYTTVRGTGGALLGSALTSAAAFATLLLHPSVVFQSFGAIVVLALVLSFLVSVFVLPSVLLLWARWSRPSATSLNSEDDAPSRL